MAEKSCVLLQDELLQKFISTNDTFIFDCDGVIYLANTPIPGVQEALNGLRKLNKRILFVTNNSTKSTKSYVQKLNNMGIQAMEDEIFGTAYVAAYYLKNVLKFPADKKVYLLGMESVADELNQMGIRNFGIGPDEQGERPTLPSATNFELDPDVGAVVSAFDAWFSLPKLVKATSYLERKGCSFIATNCDVRFPLIHKNIIFPGTGCQVAALETAARRKPVVVGKPCHPMFDCISQRHKDLVPSRTCMVGDNLHTDILFGLTNGMNTLFVETGVSTLQEVREIEISQDPQRKKMIPDFYLPSVADLKPVL